MLFRPEISRLQACTGRNLAHGRRSPSQRAAVAAQLVLGELQLTNPTITQSAGLLDVCVPYVRKALSVNAADLAALAAGEITITQLMQPPLSVLFVRTWDAASPRERIEFARCIGPEHLFDNAVAPALG